MKVPDGLPERDRKGPKSVVEPEAQKCQFVKGFERKI